MRDVHSRHVLQLISNVFKDSYTRPLYRDTMPLICYQLGDLSLLVQYSITSTVDMGAYCVPYLRLEYPRKSDQGRGGGMTRSWSSDTGIYIHKTA